MVDALVRLGGSLRLCLGVLDLFEEADLLACLTGLLVVSLPTSISDLLTVATHSAKPSLALEVDIC